MRAFLPAALAGLVYVSLAVADMPPTNLSPGSTLPTAPAGTVSEAPRVAGAAGATNGCDDCGESCRVWGSVEYLLGWTRGQHLPPLVTTSPAGTGVNVAGVLGTGTTSILIGNGNVNTRGRSGGRFELGYWLDDCRDIGIGGSFMMLEEAQQEFHAMSSGDPILARPFFDVVNQVPSSQLVAFPGVAAGCIDVSTFSQFLGAEGYVRKKLWCDCKGRLDVLAGYRFLELRDGLTVEELVTATAIEGNLPVGTAFAITDRFITENHFHGAEVGLMYQCHKCKWSAEVIGLIALGGTAQSTTIQGTTTATVNGQSAAFPAGFLALATNSGVHEHGAFSFVPELRVSIGYEVCCGVRAFVSYNFLYWTNVVRAGDQVNLAIDPNNLPPPVGGGPQPVFADQRNDLWFQAIGLGIACKY